MKIYQPIISHYEDCLDTYGDTHKGVDWPNVDDMYKRYDIMLQVIKNVGIENPSLLDFGCGLGFLYEYILRENINISYSGLEVSEKFYKKCTERFPGGEFIFGDLMQQPDIIGGYDYM